MGNEGVIKDTHNNILMDKVYSGLKDIQSDNVCYKIGTKQWNFHFSQTSTISL